MSDTTLDQILAKYPAREEDVVNIDEPLITLVVIRLGNDLFAFHGRLIKEVLSGDEPVYHVPGMPDSVEGVIHLRGVIESVILLHPLLQLPAPHLPGTGALLLGQGKTIRSAVRVDRMLDVIELPQSLIQPVPETLPAALRPYCCGLFDYRGQPATLLDLELVFSAWQQGEG